MYLYVNMHLAVNNKILSGDSKPNIGIAAIQPHDGERGSRLGEGVSSHVVFSGYVGELLSWLSVHPNNLNGPFRHGCIQLLTRSRELLCLCMGTPACVRQNNSPTKMSPSWSWDLWTFHSWGRGDFAGGIKLRPLRQG